MTELPRLLSQAPLCDGRHCPRRASCARWILHCDRSRRPPWPILSNTAPPPAGHCPLYLPSPHPLYPQTPE